MQLTAQEQELMTALGRNQAWSGLIQKLEAEQIKVLKVNGSLEQLCRAQGAVQLLDSLREASKPKQ